MELRDTRRSIPRTGLRSARLRSSHSVNSHAQASEGITIMVTGYTKLLLGMLRNRMEAQHGQLIAPGCVLRDPV